MTKRKVSAIVFITDNELYPDGLTKGSEHSVGFDLKISEDFSIRPGAQLRVDTKVAVKPPAGHSAYIDLRSSTRMKGFTSNGLGIIDPDYTGNLLIILHNTSNSAYSFSRGDKFAQLFFLPFPNIQVQYEESLEETERGSGGFGSTGK